MARIARAEGLNRLSKLEPAPVYRRYERAEPGELLHLDIKKLGRIVKVGHRITGDRRGAKGSNIGWDYLHVAIDDASRVAYAQVLPDEDAICCVAFLRAAVAYYAGLGVHIKGVYTDNAKAYRGRDFASTCSLLGLTHQYTSPTPRALTKAERFIQSSLREWAYARAYGTSNQRCNALPQWLHGYNWHRPHTSLAGQPPVNTGTEQEQPVETPHLATLHRHAAFLEGYSRRRSRGRICPKPVRWGRYPKAPIEVVQKWVNLAEHRVGNFLLLPRP